MSGSLDDMYREIILDHYRSPRGNRPIGRIDITSAGSNPSCGDELNLELEIEDEKVKDVHVDCRGCAISVASGSMLAELVKGKTIDEVKRTAEAVRRMLKGEHADLPEDSEDLEALQGVRNFPVRVKCALLAWVTFIQGIKNWEAGTITSKTTSTENTE
jgi:nitrogen fixation protein NifU and related proteins